MPRPGGLNALADAWGRDPANNDQDMIRRSMVPYAIAAAQLGQHQTAGRQAINQQWGDYRGDIRGNQQGYVDRRNDINPMIGQQRDYAMGQMGNQEAYGTGDMAAQGFAPTANATGALNNAYGQIRGLADRQYGYMADTRQADAAQWAAARQTGRIIRQAGNTAVNQNYAAALNRLILQRIQAQMQMQQQLEMYQ